MRGASYVSDVCDFTMLGNDGQSPDKPRVITMSYLQENWPPTTNQTNFKQRELRHGC